jgi:hypothetical protein
MLHARWCLCALKHYAQHDRQSVTAHDRTVLVCQRDWMDRYTLILSLSWQN